MATVTKAASSHTIVTTGWTNPANAEASTGDNVYATAAPAKNATVSGDFGFAFSLSDFVGASQASDVVIEQIVVTCEWKVSTTTAATLGVQLRNQNGGTALGTETTFSSTTESDSTQTITSGITAADLIAGNLAARVRDSRGNSNTAHTGSLDFVKVDVTWTLAPSQSVVDAFNRADSSSLGSSWTPNPFNNGNVSPSIITNQVGSAGVSSESYYSQSQAQSDCESGFTLAATGGDWSLNLRLSGVGASTCTGYTMYYDNAGHILLIRQNGGTTTTLATLNHTPAAGNQYRFRATGSLLEAFYTPSGGSWTYIGSATDATYSGAGYTGFFLDVNTSQRIDDYVAGPLTSTTYNDSGSGSVTLSGSKSEAQSFADSRAGTITLSGTATDSYTGPITYTDAASGTLTLTGAATESHTFTDSRSGTITLGGSATESHTASGSGSGTITLSGSSSETASAADARSGTITLGGTATDSYTGPITYTDARSGTITLSGTATSTNYIVLVQTATPSVSPSIGGSLLPGRPRS